MSPADNAYLSSLKEENRMLREALEKVENEACRGLDVGDTREAIIDIKYIARDALREGARS